MQRDLGIFKNFYHFLLIATNKSMQRVEFFVMGFWWLCENFNKVTLKIISVVNYNDREASVTIKIQNWCNGNSTPPCATEIFTAIVYPVSW